jgi:ABC-2 type transport system permease protein
MKALFRSLWSRRELLLMLVSRNLKIRYKSSFLGFFWSLLTPLCFIVIYALFARILRFNDGSPIYLQFLIVGIVSWQFFLSCMNDSLHAVIGNGNLIKKTSFPRLILPVSTVLANLVNFMLTVAVLLVYLCAIGLFPKHLVVLLSALLTQTALCLGVSFLASASNVFFRDTEHIIGVLSLAWFFLTPIFYSIERQLQHVPRSLEWMVFLNPMTGVVCSTRHALLGTDLPAGWGVLLSAGVAWAFLFMGLSVFQAAQTRFADEL